ncbi:hypothetical protein L7F22_040619 [Adiantum nelumboides]|nr:hypothetical protein [Adiantum nelumboides]
MALVSNRLLLLLGLLALILASCCSDINVGAEDPQGEVNLDKNTAYNNALKCLQNQVSILVAHIRSKGSLYYQSRRQLGTCPPPAMPSPTTHTVAFLMASKGRFVVTSKHLTTLEPKMNKWWKEIEAWRKEETTLLKELKKDKRVVEEIDKRRKT